MKPFILLRKICQNKQFSSNLHIIVIVAHIDVYLSCGEDFHILQKKAWLSLALSEYFIKEDFILLGEADLFVKFEGELTMEFDIEGRP